MSPGGIETDTTDLERQIAKLMTMEQIATPHLRAAMVDSLRMVSGEWKAIAPHGLGTYEGSIVGELKSVVGLEVQGVVSTNVTGAGGFAYPAMLELSKRFHYASGSRQGAATKGRVRHVLFDKKPAILQCFVQAIEAALRDLVVH